jgi:hypothetical protein
MMEDEMATGNAWDWLHDIGDDHPFQLHISTADGTNGQLATITLTSTQSADDTHQIYVFLYFSDDPIAHVAIGKRNQLQGELPFAGRIGTKVLRLAENASRSLIERIPDFLRRQQVFAAYCEQVDTHLNALRNALAAQGQPAH